MVGRVVAVQQKGWRVDVMARQEAVLQLAAIYLPGGEQVCRYMEGVKLNCASMRK